jgi:hypothetical protein
MANDTADALKSALTLLEYEARQRQERPPRGAEIPRGNAAMAAPSHFPSHFVHEVTA